MKTFSVRHFLSLLFIVFSALNCTKDFQKDNSTILLNGVANGGAQVENAPAGARGIKDAYIVVFKDNVADVDQLTEALSKQGGFKSKFRYKHAIKGFAATIPAQALEGIRRNPNVKYIEQDQEVRLESITQTGATWGIDRIDQSSLPLSGSYTYRTTGSTVDAYIFDTGIRYDHSEFGGRAIQGYDAFGGTGSDVNGHGTHVAGTVGGIVYGVAKGVRLISVKVLGDNGSGSWANVIAGLDWVVGHHDINKPAVGNMSLGGGASASVDDAVRKAISDRIVMCLAAGNSSADAGGSSPARTVEAITVGATTSGDGYATYSNFGSVVDILAPGTLIQAAAVSSQTGITSKSGTSMASPHVAGVAALYLEAYPGATPLQVQDGLKSSATPNKISSVPSATVNLLLQTTFVAPPPSQPDIPILSLPASGAINVSTSPTFSWSASSNTETYTLEVSTTSNFTAGTVQAFTTTNTSQSITGLSQGTVYHWRVIARNSIGNSTSSQRSFTTLLNAPQLSAPINNVVVSITPTLSWVSVPGATNYDIQVSTRSNFSRGVISYISNSNSYTITSPLSSRVLYYWRVRARTSTVVGSWSSPIGSFTTN
jgi:subtilisin family serine protease